MLHEVILALSGHASPLFEAGGCSDFPLITAAESALLESIGHLAELHRLLRDRLTQLSKHHDSVICRAVATSMRTMHLARFQHAIVDVERGILLKDPSSVGAYDIVPLASVAAEFEPWRRRLEWYWDVVQYMDATSSTADVAVKARQGSTGSNGVQLLDKLRKDSQTGFRDIESVATELTSVAERTWIRLLAQWIFNGAIPPLAGNDFFVSSRAADDTTGSAFVIQPRLVPTFVTGSTTSSILFIGKTVSMLKASINEGPAMVQGSSIDEPAKVIATSFLQTLADLPSPIVATRLSRIVSEMRSTLAREVVERVLPIHDFMKVLTMLRQFFLVGRGDFVDTLIQEADDYLANRHRQLQTGSKSGADTGLAGVMMKEGEIKAVIARTFTALAPFISKDSLVDEDLEWAREHIALTTAMSKSSPSSHSSDPDVRFKDYLLSTPVEMRLKLDSTFDLMFDPSDLATYSSINAYLLAIRRGHNRLSNLWRITQFRRDLPAPKRSQRSNNTGPQAFEPSKRKRQLFMERMHKVKKTWSVASAATTLLAELGRYLSDEVVEGSWRAFRQWAVQGGDDVVDAFASSTISAPSAPGSLEGNDKGMPNDPEILAQGHHQYLNALIEMLLLVDAVYTRNLRGLLTSIDHFVALMQRLQTAYRNVDLQNEGVLEDNRNYANELALILSELDKASDNMGDGIAKLLKGLRHSSNEPRAQPRITGAKIGFEPFSNVAGVDRLLVRLDFRTDQDRD